jgi:transglutaminase-like putative cysteine protease
VSVVAGAVSAEREVLGPLAWACAAFAGGVLLNAGSAPLWAVVSALVLIAWRLATARSTHWVPGTPTRAVLALGLVVIVLARFHTLNGLAAGTTLLMLMAALKLLETRTRRDQSVLVGAALFLLLAACLEGQSLARTPLYALETWLCCAALAVIAAAALSTRAALWLAGRALLLALPLALLLFLFFPRLPGSFWAIPHREEATSGLSDTMSPGSISQLILSYEPAFRVRFRGLPPPPQELYWRGPVLHDFDGYTWRRMSGVFLPRQPLRYLGEPYRYQVSLEPSRERWWFALDTPQESAGARALLTYDYELVGSEPVRQLMSFDAVSYTHSEASEALDPGARRQDTYLPRNTNPRAAALAHTLRQQAPEDAAFVQAVLDYLRRGGFVYSLTPERLGRDAVDDFLFNTRSGFCGHYASAFVTLMRAAGVPARVVSGYLGGEWNPAGGYFIVRQSDAHAWAEVWLAGRGWTRFDPTAVVAPERLRRGILDLMPDSLSVGERLVHESPWLAHLLQRWDAANNWWSEHVVRYDYLMQLDLLTRLGVREPDVRHLGWAFTLALLVWLALIGWSLGRGARPVRPDALARAYARLCRKLARVAPARAPHQGPLSFAAAVAAHRPDIEGQAGALLARYAQLRYGPSQPATRALQIEEFRRAVARLSLPRRAPRPLTAT